MSKPQETLQNQLKDLTGVDAYKVVYQFVGNNHMLRTNTLVFFTKTVDEAKTMAQKFLNENNLPWFKILSVTRG